MSGAAAVVETAVEMSRRGAGGEKMCDLCSCGVEFDTCGSGINLHTVGSVVVGERLELFAGLPSKVAMVMMTLLAFLRRKACRFSTSEFLCS